MGVRIGSVEHVVQIAEVPTHKKQASNGPVRWIELGLH